MVGIFSTVFVLFYLHSQKSTRLEQSSIQHNSIICYKYFANPSHSSSTPETLHHSALNSTMPGCLPRDNTAPSHPLCIEGLRVALGVLALATATASGEPGAKWGDYMNILGFEPASVTVPRSSSTVKMPSGYVLHGLTSHLLRHLGLP